MNNLGLCGVHRTGKTTLAIALSLKLGIPFVPIDASGVFLRLHLSPSQPMDIRTRLAVQQEILKQAESIWFKADQSFICDRTPLDMAAYLLADVTSGGLAQDIQDEIMSYVGQCFQVTKKYFDKLVIIPPAIPFIPSEFKAAINEPLIFGLHYQILGMLSCLGVNYQKLPNECMTVVDRVNFVSGYWKQK